MSLFMTAKPAYSLTYIFSVSLLLVLLCPRFLRVYIIINGTKLVDDGRGLMKYNSIYEHTRRRSVKNRVLEMVAVPIGFTP